MTDELLESTRRQYGLQAQALPGAGEELLLRNFVPSLSPHTTLRLQRRAAQGEHTNHFTDHYGDPDRVDVHVIVSVSQHACAADAREALLRFLSQCMTRLSACGDCGIHVGDQCFCGQADPVSHLIFTRGNMLVEVASVGSATEAVGPLATIVDAQMHRAFATEHISRKQTRGEIAIGTQYEDLLVRDNFGDDGTIPSQGAPFHSPDVLPLQSVTFGFPQANDSYDSGDDLGKAILAPGINNIYVRAKNLGTTNSSGTASLYYSSSNLFLLPATWNAITLPDGTGAATMLDASQSSIIQSKSVCLSNPAFLLTNLPASGAHYCIISVLQTPAHPVVIPQSFPSNAYAVSWVLNNPGVGWRNLNVVPASTPQIVATYGYSNITPAYLLFRCIGVDLPVGSTVTLQSTDARCPFSFQGLLPAPDPTGQQILVFEQWVPNLESPGSSVFAVVRPAEGSFAKTSRFTLTSLQVPNASVPLEMEVAEYVALPLGHPLADARGQAYLIKLGESTLVLE
jgi:hypothetical protein